MSLLAPLVLARDVVLTPLVDLDPETRAGIAGEDGDVAVSRPASRQPSVVVDADAAALLGLFREPRTVADAVIRFSRPRDLDPDEVLTGAYPLVQRFFSSRVLETAAAAGEPRPEDPAAPLDSGVEIGPWRVVRTVARLDDVEVVQVRDANGRVAALKVARNAERGMAAATLDAEAAILRHLVAAAPGLAPAPWSQGVHEERTYLALEWCSGVDLAAAGAEARAAGPQAVRGLLTQVARAYARLHDTGVCQGDIHPRNILIDAAGGVKLIDFGLAVAAVRPPGEGLKSLATQNVPDGTKNSDPASALGPPSPRSAPSPRGGIGFYFEPEYAQALVSRAPSPAATPAGEQYSLAAVLYEAATGRPYLDFRLGREELLGQIVTDAPLPFAARGVASLPALETVLRQALAKSPAERHPSTSAFAAALESADLPDSPDLRDLPDLPIPLGGFVRELAAEAAEDGPWMQGELRAPTASLNYGAAGVALGLLRLAERRGDTRLLARAEAWLTRAEREAGAEAAFFNPEIEITREVVGESSPYHSPAGLAAVRARFARAVGDRAGQAAAVRAFVALSELPPAGDDLTLGRSATVLGAALVLDALAGASDERAAVLALGRRRLGEVWDHLDREPAIAESALDNLGIAHGWAGFAYAALHWHRASGDPLPAQLPARLDQLAALAEPTGRGLEWPWQLGRERLTMPGWCNGSAGHTLLWALAHRLTHEPRYLELARGAGWSTWEAPRSSSTTLCCGLAGRAYALLALYRATGDAGWRERARELAATGVTQSGREPTYRHALWKGDLGLAVLIADLDRPAEAAMPWFEDEAW